MDYQRRMVKDWAKWCLLKSLVVDG